MSSPSLTAAPGDARPSVTVLCGFWPAATDAVARALLGADPALVAIRHDSMSTPDALTRLARAHPGRNALLVLSELVEPEAIATACGHALVDGVPLTDLVRIDSYVTVVDAEYLLDGLCTNDDLSTLGIHAAADDRRTLAGVVVRQIEFADTVVLWGSCADGPLATAQAHALLHRLAPWATCLHLDGDRIDPTDLARQLRHTHRHRPQIPTVLARGIEGYPLGVHEPEPYCDVVSTVFRARRPLHAQRLHDALEVVNAGVIRSRGHAWLASQPDTVVAWDVVAGELAFGTLGRWLADTPGARWDQASDLRRLAAAATWDPYYGERNHHLVFIGIDLDAAGLHRGLSGCLLTDAELADGEEVWRTYADPFTGSFSIDADTPTARAS